MTDEAKEIKDDAARADADAGEKLDKILSCVDSLSKRMDSMEDIEKKKADAAKADAEEEEKKADAEEEEKKKELAAKADAALEEGKLPGEAKEVAADKRKDAEEDEKKADSAARIADLETLIKDMSAKMPKHLSDAEFHEMTQVQARADTVFQAFGDSAPRPLQGEDIAGYRRRLATQLKSHSTTWKDTNVAAIFDDNAFGAIETQVYADALQAASAPVDVEPGHLREIKKADITGRIVSTFVGEPAAWMSGFTGHRRRLVGINQAR